MSLIAMVDFRDHKVCRKFYLELDIEKRNFHQHNQAVMYILHKQPKIHMYGFQQHIYTKHAL